MSNRINVKVVLIKKILKMVVLLPKRKQLSFERISDIIKVSKILKYLVKNHYNINDLRCRILSLGILDIKN